MFIFFEKEWVILLHSPDDSVKCSISSMFRKCSQRRNDSLFLLNILDNPISTYSVYWVLELLNDRSTVEWGNHSFPILFVSHLCQYTEYYCKVDICTPPKHYFRKEVNDRF